MKNNFKKLLHYTNKLHEGGKSWNRNIEQLKAIIKSDPTIQATLKQLTK